ncbi:MAG: MFS transporter [Clostridia bacterium]|nr:MFS transporter [Clostridia bacterium]
MSEAIASKGVSNGTKWRVMLVIFLFYFFSLGFTNQFFNVALNPMITDMGWDAAQGSAISNAMFLGMIWFVFVAGFLLDKFSVKKLYVLEIFLVGVVFALRGVAQGFIFFYVLMILYGVLSAFYVPTCVKLISLWFDGKQIALANGILTSASPCGQLVANVAGWKLAMAIGGWKTMYVVTGICCVLVAILAIFLVKDRKSEDAALASAILTRDDLSFGKNIKGVASTPSVWIYIIANGFFVGFVYAIMAFQNYVYQTDPGWGLDPSVSGTIPAFSNCVSMCCYVLVPLLFARLGIQKWWGVAAIFCAIGAITLVTIMWFSYSYVYACISMATSGLLYGCCLPAPKVLLLQLPEVSGPRAGTAIGIYTTIERLCVVIFIAIIGPKIISWDPSMHDGLGSSTLVGKVQMLMYLQPLLLALALIVNKKRYGNIFAHVAKKEGSLAAEHGAETD